MEKKFTWGTATSAYQVEGAAQEDGRGLSIWDSFVKQKGRIADGSDGSVACDHYHRYKEDVALLKELGVNAYRFSVSWTRLLPSGEGQINQKGADFYSRLIDELLKNDITPVLTLHHWDYPLALYYKGGWLNRDLTDLFGEYAQKVVQLYGDRVNDYITLNEPQCMLGCAYDDEDHAPGTKTGTREQLQILHNFLLAHGKAAKIIRESGAKVSIAPTSNFYIPATEKDIEAARAASMGAMLNSWIWSDNYYLDPIVFGKYPEEYYEKFADVLPEIKPGDMKIISEPIDYICQNIYRGDYVRCGANGKAELLPRAQGEPHTDMNWRVTPDVLYWATKFITERYKLPLVISENGSAYADLPSTENGKTRVHDGARVEYIRSHLKSVIRAREEGLPLIGYFYWSLLDNFEWSFGYNRRFGLVYVDYKTQQRIKKDSFDFYKNAIKADGNNLNP